MVKTNPVEIFKTYFEEELKQTKASLPAACCLSTIGIDGYPNARYVALKGIVDNYFIITGSLSSRKGAEINQMNKVALTFWWTETERQVRIQGHAKPISDELADNYFSERNRESQIVSIVSEQGQTLDDIQTLNKKYQEIEKAFFNQSLPRPLNWGGYSIKPLRIEFLEFKLSRFHDRKLFELKNNAWAESTLQP